MIEARRNSFLAYLQNKNEKNKLEHRKIQNEVRKLLRNMENKFYEQKASEMQSFSDRGNSHAYFKALKEIYGPKQSKKAPHKLLKKDGSETKSEPETLDRLREYYSDLLNRKICVDSAVETYLDEISKLTCWELDANPSIEELNKILKKAKNITKLAQM